VTRGGFVTLYLSGAGEVSNQILTGWAPTNATAREYQPLLPVSVTVGGTQTFVLAMNLAANEYGTTQITILVPNSVPTGVQPVVATIGGNASPPVNVTVQ